jgi:prepilin-type processing-associated H-X9-DG protein
MTISIQVRDHAAFSAHFDQLVKAMNQVLAMRPAGAAEPPQFHKKNGPHNEYVLEFPPGSAPEGVVSLLSPTIALDKEQLIISGTTAAAEKALALTGAPDERRWSATSDFVPMAQRLPGNMVLLNVADPRDTLPVLIDNLPAIAQAYNSQVQQAARMAQARGARPGPDMSVNLDVNKLPTAEQLRPLLFPASTAISVDARGLHLLQREALPSITSPTSAGVMVALLLPAVQAAREAARRAQCTNNLKQILLAFHNYVSANNALPKDYTDKDGKPLLSWRVAILPYLEQGDLYNKFKLDEPWDSPNNKPLLKEMPKAFHCPDRTKAEPFTTTYRGFSGPFALFDDNKSVTLADVTDGTSNTIAVAEAKDAVPWTKPDDLPFDPQAAPSLFGAGSPHPGGFNCGFADGSVRFIKNSINTRVFQALITRCGGEVISNDAF